jgi:glycosyltransferase involved in cell wall biosynthesis
MAVRVALIGPVPPQLGGRTPGGVATHQLHLARGLAAAGVDAALLATNTRVCADAFGPTHEDGLLRVYRMIAAPRLNRRTVSALGGYRRLFRYSFDLTRTRNHGSRREVLRNVLGYRRFLNEVRPDLIHVQHPLERCAYVRRVQRLEGWRIPVVVTAHSLFGEHEGATIYALMAPNLRVADRVIAVSQHIAEQSAKLGVDPARVRVIPSGVDTQRFRPATAQAKAAARGRLAIPTQAHLVLFVGNLEPRKQVDVLLRAIARVRLGLPEVELLVVGSGESAGTQDQTARLLRLTEELQLTRAVRFVGRLDDEQLLDAYAAADVFALPSSSEAQGIVALEAMACGLPVVASAVGGLPATIVDQESGFLVPYGDVDALAARVADLLGDAVRRGTIGEAARRTVEHRYTWSRAVAATCEVYREAIACR